MSWTKNPYMLCRHFNVVPEGDSNRWSKYPFLGETIYEGGIKYIYGRGTIDDKQSVFAIVGVLKFMLSYNEIPKTTFYMAI